MLAEARKLAALGLSPLAIDPKTKQPWHLWKKLQTEAADDLQLQELFRHPGLWLGLACGYGGLEVLDFDIPKWQRSTLDYPPAYEPWRGLVRDHAGDELLDRLLIGRSPSGGVHVYYTVEQPGRNQKLASRPWPAEIRRMPSGADRGDPDRSALIETRGAGGLVVVSPSPGYTLGEGRTFANLPAITVEERDLLFDCARLLDEMPIVPERTSAPAKSAPRREGEALSPGDDFDRRATWEEILEPHGWRKSRRYGGMQLWVRPGKKASEGHSARTGVGTAGDRFLCWSSTAPFPVGEPLLKYATYAFLNHGGDFSAAIKALAAQGYGERPKGSPGVQLPDGPRRNTPGETSESLPTHAPPPGMEFLEHLDGFEDEPEDDGEVPEESAPYKWDLTETGLAELYVRWYGNMLRYCHLWGAWLHWDGTRWEKDQCGGAVALQYSKTALRRMAQEGLRLMAAEDKSAGPLLEYAAKSLTKSRRENMVSLAKSEPGVAVSPDQLDRHPDLLPVANGVIDTRTGELRAHDRHLLMTKALKVRYNPNADCPMWVAALERLLPDEEVRRYFWKFAGYSLTGHTREKVFAFLYGSGDNGKSMVVEVLMNILGEYATANSSDLIMSKVVPNSNTNDLAELKGIRMVAMSETEEGRRLDEALIKRLTGGDRIKARFLYQGNFEFDPEFKIWMFGNHKPRIKGTDDAIWRRVALIPFEVVIPKKEQDGELKTKLITQEAEGILAWLVDGCLAWRKEGLEKPQAVSMAVMEYRAESDALGRFLDECTVQDSSRMIKASTLYDAYKGWASKVGEKTLTLTVFGRSLQERNEMKKRLEDGYYYLGRGLAPEEGEDTVYRGGE